MSFVMRPKYNYRMNVYRLVVCFLVFKFSRVYAENEIMSLALKIENCIDEPDCAQSDWIDVQDPELITLADASEDEEPKNNNSSETEETDIVLEEEADPEYFIIPDLSHPSVKLGLVVIGGVIIAGVSIKIAENNDSPPAEPLVPITAIQHSLLATNENQAPTIHETEKVDALVGEAIELLIQVSDPDTSREQLLFELVGQIPEGASLDREDGLFTWTPSVAQTGCHVFEIVVTDSTEPTSSNQGSLTICVQDGVDIWPI